MALTISRVRVLAFPVMGLAMLWPSFRVSFYFALFDGSLASRGQLELFYSLFLVGAIGCLLVFSVFETLANKIILNVPVSVCFGLLLPVSFLVLSCVHCDLLLGVAVGCAGSVFAGSSAGFLILGWLLVLSLEEVRRSSIAAIIASLLHMFLACVLSLATGIVFAALFLSMLLACVLLWIAQQRISRDAWFRMESSCDHTAISLSSSLRIASKRTTALVLLFTYSGVVLWGFLSPDRTGVVSAAQHLATFIISGAILLFLIAENRCFGDKRISFMRTTLVILFIASLFVILAFRNDETHLGTSMLMAAIFCLEVFSLIVLLNVTALNRCSSVRVFSGGLIAFVFAPALLRNITAPFLFNVFGLSAFDLNNDEAILAVTFLLVAATILFLSFDGISGSGRCADVGCPSKYFADSYGLTARECDVLELLAKGNSQKKISQLLHVAPTTIQSHAKAIYRKLGVHTKQELIDLVHESEAND